MAPLGPARPYRDFLTPALHKRFTDASFHTILLCYVIALWMGDLTPSLWSWLPIGPPGIRMLLLFIPALVVFILRVAQWHVGRRITQTPWETFSKYALRKNTVLTVGGYLVSAWFFSEVYIWTQPKKARLGFTDHGGKQHDLVRLNERPLYLRFMFVTLAVAQAGLHLWGDYDNIEIPVTLPSNDRDVRAVAQRSLKQDLTKKLRSMGMTSVILASVTTVAGTVFYLAGFRYLLWEYYYNFAKRLVSLRKTSTPFGLPPFLPLVLMFLTEGALLVFLWQFVNKAFDYYISQAPLKKDQPITNESKDPNGSLLNGLKSKKDTSKAVALWELALITERFPERRKTIYGELERKKGPTYQQVTDICLAEVRQLVARIGVATTPRFQPPAVVAERPDPGTISLIPQIAQPLKDAPINVPGSAPASRLEKFEALTASVAKTASSPQNSQQAYAREYLKKGQEKLVQGVKDVDAASNAWFSKLVASPLGGPFRHSLRRTVSLIMSGAPYSRLSLLCNAITALTNLTVHSLREDDCGQFQKVVPEIVRDFTTAIKQVDGYVAKVQVHWSDYETLALAPELQKNVPEVETVKECLRIGLDKILKAFNEYLSNMEGLSRAEVQAAKQAVARGPEMAVVR